MLFTYLHPPKELWNPCPHEIFIIILANACLCQYCWVWVPTLPHSPELGSELYGFIDVATEVTMNYISRGILRVLLAQNLILLLWRVRFIAILFLSGINGIAETKRHINLISGYNCNSLINRVLKSWLIWWSRLKMELKCIQDNRQFVL